MKNPRDPSWRMCCRDEQGEERSIMRRIQGVCGRWTQDGPKGGMILMAVCFHCSHKIQCLLCVSICMSHPSLSKVLIKPPFPSEANLWEAFFFFPPLGSTRRHFATECMPPAVYHNTFIFRTSLFICQSYFFRSCLCKNEDAILNN